MVAELGLENGAEDGGDDAAPVTAKRPPAPTTRQINKLIRALVLRRLEMMMQTVMPDGEQEQKLLDTVSRTMGKLEDLDKQRRETGAPPRRSTKAVLELRRKIASRIEQLNQG